MRRICLCCVLLLTGCARDEFTDLRAFMARSGQGVQQPLEPLPAVRPQRDFKYDPSGLSDPFSPRGLKPSKGGGLQPDLTRPKEPLELEPLDGLHMVGTLKKGGQLYALVRRPDNTLYRLAKGDRIGQNFGVIVSISESRIEIKEMIQDGAGDWTESKASLALQE